jgi:galactonate dehydratase
VKIVDLKTYVVNPHGPGGRNWIFVKLITDNGIEGIGEAFDIPFAPHPVAKLIESTGERFILGTDPFNIELMWRTIYASGYDQHPDTTKMAIISAFEIACWDIIGKALGQPIYNLLGGKYHERLRTYTYMNPAPGKSQKDGYVQNDPQAAAERAAHYLKMGFTAIKFDPVGPGTVHAPLQLTVGNLANSEAVIGAVREAVGDKCDIIIGTHGQMTTSAAIRLAKRLEKFDPLWFEEPVPPENRDEMARVARHTSIPIGSGERLSTKYEFRELLEKQAAAVMQVSLGRVGGLLEAKKIAGMAEAYYAQIAPHLYAGPVEAMANVHIATCSPNFLILEGLETWGGFYNEILDKPFRWEEGYLIPPDKPGLGIELNEEVMKKYSVTENVPSIDVSYESPIGTF